MTSRMIANIVQEAVRQSTARDLTVAPSYQPRVVPATTGVSFANPLTAPFEIIGQLANNVVTGYYTYHNNQTNAQIRRNELNASVRMREIQAEERCYELISNSIRSIAGASAAVIIVNLLRTSLNESVTRLDINELLRTVREYFGAEASAERRE